MDELETLNMLLRLIGSSPVNSLETDHPDAANAVVTMDRIRGRIQRKGWWCNIDYSVTYQPDSTGNITIPKEISSLVLAEPQYVQRGNKLYNKLDQTFTFTDNVTVIKETRTLEWDDMPDVMQEYCAYYAGAEFVRDELEDASKEASLKESAANSLMDLNKQELSEGQYNIFDTSRIRRARNGVRPYSTGSHIL